jgi:acyl carrier protein
MQRADVMTVFRQAAAELLDVDPAAFVEAASFREDLGVDSLDLVEFVMAMEDRFEIRVAQEELEGVKTVGDALDRIYSKLQAAA